MSKIRAQSIGSADLAKKVSSTVSAVLESNDRFRKLDMDIGVIVDPGIVGFIIRDEDIFKASLGDVAKMAEAVTERSGGLARAGGAAVLIGKGGTTVGYFPQIDLIEFQR